jgi:hypothetical protein
MREGGGDKSRPSDDGYMLAVLPASHHIRLSDLRRQIGNDVDLAPKTLPSRIADLVWELHRQLRNRP